MKQNEHLARTTYLEQHGLPKALAASVTSISGVSKRRSEQLAKLGIYSVLDLLRHFPRRYENWQTSHEIATLQHNDKEAVVIGELVSPLRLNYKGRLSYIRSQIYDGTGKLDVIWFNQPWLVKQLRLHTPYVFRGKIKTTNYLSSLQNPRVKPYLSDSMPTQNQLHANTPLEKISLANTQTANVQVANVQVANTQTASEQTAEQTTQANASTPSIEPIEHETIETAELRTSNVANQPIYSLTASLTNVNMQTLQAKSLKNTIAFMPEILSSEIKAKYKLADSKFAYEQIHFPKDEQSLAIAKRRLAFEELFLLQLGLKTLRQNDATKLAEQVILDEQAKKTLEAFEKSLPFALTKGQAAAKTTLLKDLASNIASNRLLQGDTGSGKTVVAAYAMLACYLANKQAVLMAPTQILAKQHYESLLAFCSNYIPTEKVALVTGNLTAKERKEIAKKISSNEIALVIGTHAVLNENWQWPALALAVTDEQHRFGVNQRLSFLHDKQLYPHLLVMSATPIPRSLALVLYGDLNVSVIAEKPAKRKPILTYMANMRKLPKIYEYVTAMLARGKQVYWICPLVEPADEAAAGANAAGTAAAQAAAQGAAKGAAAKAAAQGAARASKGITYETNNEANVQDSVSDLMAATTRQASLQATFKELAVGLVHGKMKDALKNQVMQDFYDGKIQILVATTVVEVGVDNPNANLIVIENAERFGLAQLHQLRGRVGRGEEQAICILLSEQATLQAKQANSVAYKRLETLCSSNDGFYLANQDLKLRGPGDFFGVRQHGLPDFKLANLYEDKELIAETQQAVNELLKLDPNLAKLEHAYLKKAIAWYYPDLENHVVL